MVRAHSAMAASWLFIVAAVGAAAPVDTAVAASIVVPWIGQKTSSECGRAVLASLAARRGGNIEQHYARLPKPPDNRRGYSITDMQRFAGRVGVKLTLRTPAGIVIAGECSPRPAVTAHFEALARAVESGTPAVVPVAIGWGAGHYLVLVGVGGGGFTALDPAAPGLRKITTADLARRMCDYGYIALLAP